MQPLIDHKLNMGAKLLLVRHSYAKVKYKCKSKSY